jgi:hypothetical protein
MFCRHQLGTFDLLHILNLGFLYWFLSGLTGTISSIWGHPQKFLWVGGCIRYLCDLGHENSLILLFVPYFPLILKYKTLHIQCVMCNYTCSQQVIEDSFLSLLHDLEKTSWILLLNFTVKHLGTESKGWGTLLQEWEQSWCLIYFIEHSFLQFHPGFLH